MTIPPILLNQTRYCCINLPSKVAEAPNNMNTSENPTIKLRAPAKIRRIELCVFSLRLLNSSKDKPEIKEMYPGTKGRTQGERKDKIPAKNAAQDDTSCNMNMFLIPFYSLRIYKYILEQMIQHREENNFLPPPQFLLHF